MQPSSSPDRPVAVLIVGPHPIPDGVLEPILWGLEEEGIPAGTEPAAAGTVAEMAKLAADGSPLNVGIAVSGADRAVALHHRDLAASQPLFILGPAELEPALLRRLGVNAARLVKGNPLVVDDEPAHNAEPVAPRNAAARAQPAAPAQPTARGQPAVSAEAFAPAETFQDLVDEITAMVVARLLSQHDWRPLPSNRGHAP